MRRTSCSPAFPALLASAAPATIPADVTARVVAAIEREQIARASQPDEAHAGQAAPARPKRAAFRQRIGARVGAGLLGATAVLGGGYLVVSGVLGGGDESEPTSGAVAERSLDDSGGDSPEDGAAAPNPPGAQVGGLSYSAATFDEDVQRLLDSAGVYSTTRSPGEAVSPGEVTGDPIDALSTCVSATQRRADSDFQPLVVDYSTYEGEPAVIIVLPGDPSSGETSAVDVWVIGTGCVGDSDVSVPQAATRLDVLRRETVQR